MIRRREPVSRTGYAANPCTAAVVCLLSLVTCALGAGPVPLGVFRSTAAVIPTFVPPVNDNCVDASIATDGTTPFTTIDATTDGSADPLCLFAALDQVENDVWFKYLAECTGDLTVHVCDSTYDTRLAVYDGCDVCPPTDSPLDCDDDGCDLGIFTSQLTVPVVERDCYLIRIGAFSPFSGGHGTGMVSVTCEPTAPVTGACCNDVGTCLGTMIEPACGDLGGTWFEAGDCDFFVCPVSPPENDLCANCTTVFTDTPVNGTTLGAGGIDETLNFNCGFEDTRDTWYCWTSDCTGDITFSLCDPDPALTVPLIDTTLAVFDACLGEELGCNDDDCGFLSELTLDVTAETTYFIRVSGHDSTSGEYTLNVDVGDCPVLGACCLFNDVVQHDICLPGTFDQCSGADGTWFGAGSVCLGDNDGSGVDDLCELDSFFWLDYNAGSGGYVPDFDQNNDFDNDDGDDDASTGVDPFYNGPAAVADSVWWLENRFPGRDIVGPGTGPSDLIQDLAGRMATGGQTASPNGHLPPFSGTFVDDMHSGLRNYLTDNGLTGVIVERSLLEPPFDTVAADTLLQRNVTLLLGFYRIESAIPAGGDLTLVNWRRTGGQYVTVAGVDVVGPQVGLVDPDADAAEEGGEGQVRGTDHDHDADGTPGTSLPFRDPGYDHNRHQVDKGFASQDAYDATPAFTPKATGLWVLSVDADPLVYAAEQEPFHAEDAGGAFDLVSSSLVDDTFLANNGYPVPSGGQIYTVVEAAVILGRFGDADGDGLPTLADHVQLADCMSGPGVPPAPTPPTTADECLAAFDADGDGDVDLFDASFFVVEFVGP